VPLTTPQSSLCAKSSIPTGFGPAPASCRRWPCYRRWVAAACCSHAFQAAGSQFDGSDRSNPSRRRSNPGPPWKIYCLAPALLDFTSRSVHRSSFLTDRSWFLRFSPSSFSFFANKSLILFRRYLLRFSFVLAFFMSM
jgi:hypothetical protein